MKSTLIFLSLLFVISCSENTLSPSTDSVLLEIATDPRSEAVFATMAIQLKQSGGFDRVLALLNELVDDGRKQLHSSTKRFENVSANCEVSTMKFSERQAFYVQRGNSISEALASATREAGVSHDSQVALSASSVWFTQFLKTEKERHGRQIAFYNNKIKIATTGATNVEQAIAAVRNWNVQNAKSGAFIQEKLNTVANSYLETHAYKIFVPESLIQMAATDASVKQRILEWLSMLKVTFLEAAQSFQTNLKNRRVVWTSLETQVATLITTYATDVRFLVTVQNFLTTNAANLKASQTLFAKLVDRNNALVAANRKFCDIEVANFANFRKTLDSQLKLFRNIRNYFRTNYANISQFVKSKYNAVRRA